MSRLPSLGPRGEGWLVVQIVLMVAVYIACASAAADRFPVGFGPGRVVGVGLFVFGWVVGILGVFELRHSFTTLPRPAPGGELVQNGIYRWLRNPIYAGLIMVTVGGSLWRGSGVGLVLSLVLAVFLDLKARREEALLSARFPDYDSYVRRVRRFVPGLY